MSARMDFSDTRVILVTPEDPRSSVLRDTDPTCCHAGQDFDGPTFITIGKLAKDASLAKVSESYGVPLAELHEFRERQSAREVAAIQD